MQSPGAEEAGGVCVGLKPLLCLCRGAWGAGLGAAGLASAGVAGLELAGSIITTNPAGAGGLSI